MSSSSQASFPASAKSLAIIVIGFNEAAHLESCLISIKEVTQELNRFISSTTILYIDSNSDDSSVNIAQHHADAIFRLDGFRSAAAARQVGLDHTSADLVLFLDGDMELQPGWLSLACERLLEVNRPGHLVGVTGIRHDIYVDPVTRNVLGSRENVYHVSDNRIAPHIGGAWLVYRDIVVTAGGYRSQMKWSEEPDLYARLRQRGHYVLELAVPFIRHFTEPQPSLAKRMWRLFVPHGPSHYFGVSLLCSLREKYLKGLLQVFPVTFAVWGADLGSIIGLALGSLPLFLLIQFGVLASLTVLRKPQEFVIARGRLCGVLMASVSQFRNGPCVESNRNGIKYTTIK